MKISRVANRLLLLSPGIFLLGLGVHSRTYQEYYEPVGYNQAQQDSLRSYGKLIAESEKVRLSPHSSVRELKEQLTKWEAKVASDRMLAMNAISLDDFVNDGVKGEVFRAQFQLSAMLINREKGDPSISSFEKGKDLLHVAGFLEKYKYVDPAAFNTSATLQRRIFKELERIDGLKPVERKELSTQLVAIRKEFKPVALLLIQEKVLADRKRAYMGLEAVTKAETLNPMKPVSSSDSSAGIAKKGDSRLVSMTNIEMESEYKVAVYSERLVHEHCDELLKHWAN